MGVMNQETYPGEAGQLYGPHTWSGKHYVYQHRNPSTGEIFYVGLGKYNRCNQRAQRNKYWKNYVNKHGLLVEILAQGLDRAEAAELEKRLIEELRPKCNFSSGGESRLVVGVPVKAFTKEGELFKKFDTIAEANAFFGIATNDSRIRRCLAGKRQRFKGFLWAIEGQSTPKYRPRKCSKAKQVHQYNLQGMWVASFDSPKDAAVPTRTGIYGALDTCRTYANSFWRSFKADRIFDSVPEKALKTPKKVICLRTGRVYDSLTVAAKENGLRSQTLSKKLRGKLHNNTNLQFYVEEKSNDSKNHQRPRS